MNDKFDFIFSTRFWAMIIGSVSVYLKMKGWIGDAEMQLIATISGLFITVKTVDRYSDKQIEAAKASGETVIADVEKEN